MNIFDNFKRLNREFFKFKKYKRMHPALAVFAGIALIPFAVLYFVLLGLLFVEVIFFTLIEAPIRALHKIVRDEGKEVKHATQAVVYFLSWGILFFFYVIYAFISFFIFVGYFFLQLFGYIASLAGYKFHITYLEENIEVEPREMNYFLFGLLLAIIGNVLLFVGAILTALGGEPSMVGGAFLGLYFLFISFYVPIVYHAREEVKQEVPQVEEKQEEAQE